MTSHASGLTFAPIEFLESNNYPPFALVSAVCGRCWSPIAIRVYSKDNNHYSRADEFRSSLGKANGQSYALTAGEFDIEVVRTPIEKNDIPKHLSPAVAKAYRSALKNYHQEDGEDAAAMLFRRALDVAIREKHPEVKGLLSPRINRLVELGLLPPSMKEWADQIRLIGNDGAHEPEGVTMAELKPMLGFTEAFLRYFITIPFEVDLHRGKIDRDGNPVK